MRIWFSLLTYLICLSSFASIVDMSVRWDKQSIEVCWGKNVHLPLTRIKPEQLNSEEQFYNNQEVEKKIIRDAITSNYNLDSSGVELTGWRNCDDNPDDVSEDVILFFNSAEVYDNTSESRASIGKNNNKKSFVLIRKLSVERANFLKPDEHLKFISLHEFGHLLGLRHEDAHPEAPIRSQEALPESVLILSGYDSMSVMSYRFTDTMMGITGLLFKLDPTNKVTSEETWKWFFPQSMMFALSRFSDVLAPSFLEDSRVELLSHTENTRRFSLAIAPSDKDLKTLRCAYIENCTLNP